MKTIFNAINLQIIDESIKDIDVSAIRNEYKVSNNDYVIALPGRLHESKGHEYLIHAIGILKEKYQITPKVFIIGEGSLRDEIEKLIKKLKIKNQFVLTGSVDQGKLFKIIKSSDIVVIPSLFEAFGLAAIESMYLEKPIIVTNINGLQEITTDNVDSLQVSVQNSDVIAMAILELINDQKLVTTLAKNAKVTASKYDVNKIVNQWIDNFESEKK